jgi:hypothetical protein
MSNAVEISMEPIKIGETRENGSLRIHRYRESLELTDLTNAGKRGKKVRRVSVGSRHIDAVCHLDRVSGMVDSAVALDRAMASINDYLTDYPSDLNLFETEMRGVDVAPAGFKAQTGCGKRVSFCLDFDSFMICCLEDRNNEPRIRNGKHSDVAKFAKWLKVDGNRMSLATMSLHDVQNALSAAGIDYHYWLAMD